MAGTNDEIAEILAAECGGQATDYEADLSDLVSLDEAAVSGTDFDMSADAVPVEFDDIDIDEAEETGHPVI